jgi:hypothetical protein
MSKAPKWGDSIRESKDSKREAPETDKYLGTICVCALRYCMGRQTYMPTLVQDFCRRHIARFDDNTIRTMIDDIDLAERTGQSMGDDEIDRPDWYRFRKFLENEKGRRLNHADKRLSALRKMQILESTMHQSGKPDV